MIGIRVDANGTIALGHIMRCMSIAEELAHREQAFIFITADEFAKEMLEEKGYKSQILHTDYKRPMDELGQLKQIIEEQGIRVLLLDSYFIGQEYISNLSQEVHLVSFDDFIEMFDKLDAIIQYSPFVDWNQYIGHYCDKGTMLYLGAKYAPLRNEFADIKRIVKREVVDVLITTGGTDQYGVAFELLRVLKEEGIFSGLRFHFVIGSIYENVEEYEALASQCSNVLLHKGLQSMSRLMLECDVAVSAGGTTLLELCACGTPAIVFSVSENQKEWVRQMINYEYMVGVGDITWNRQDKIPGIFEHLSILIEDYSLRQQLSIKMQSLVDGGGAKRIAEGLIELNEEG